jgi:hypothetical protein
MWLLAIVLAAVAKPPVHGIPPGHLPPPGSCRVWYPGTPPGHQPPPTSCRLAFRQVGPGGWVVERPAREVEIVRTYEMRATRTPVRTVVYAVSGPQLRVEVDLGR